jgi:hypothetical protein
MACPFAKLARAALLALALCCGTRPTPAEPPPDVAASARSFMLEVARGVTRDGPTAWQRYCADTPAFFMAVNGRLQFADGAAARAGIEALPALIRRIELRWGGDLRVDPLGADYAVVAASYTELQVSPKGQRRIERGFFTGVLERSGEGWKLRDAHWSSAGPRAGR